MYSVGLSSCSKELNVKLFEEYDKNNIRHMEISEADYSGFDFAKIYKLAKENNVNLWSLHLPFCPFEIIDISATDKKLRDGSTAMLSELIKKGSDIGIDKFIIHPSGEPIDASERDERMKYSKESLSILADTAAECGGVICVEDLPRTCLGHSIAEMQDLMSADARLKVCFDTNHITCEKPEDVIAALGEKIITLHVSDFDFVNERHWLPGEGSINWRNIMRALSDMNYNGVFMYEIGYACPATIIRERALNAADFRRNADELFSGSELTVISTPKQNLGMWE